MNKQNNNNSTSESICDYLKAHVLVFGKEIIKRKKIYLDTNYWIYLRDFRLGISTDSNIECLHNTITRQVESGKALCPISADTFLEIIKQTDEKKITCSAELIDELSLGASIISREERVLQELLHFFYKYLAGEDICYGIQEMAWTKLAYTLGARIPMDTCFSPEDELVLQKRFLDRIWETSLSDIISTIGVDGLRNWPRSNDISGILNQGKFSHEGECKSFNQLYLSELAGVLETMEPELIKIDSYLREKFIDSFPTPNSIQDSDSYKYLANIIHNCFRLNRITTELALIRIPASIHAAIRWDKERKFKQNDIHDFRHAEVALVYCDLFFTEKPLHSLICQNNIRLDKVYNCNIASKLADAVAKVIKLLN